MDLKKPSFLGIFVYWAGQAFGWALQTMAVIAILSLFAGITVWAIRFFLNSILS